MTNKTRKSYDEDFKRHIVKLYDAVQTKAELAKTYDLHPTTVTPIDVQVTSKLVVLFSIIL